MKSKTVYCVGYRSATSGGFDWYHNAADAEAGFATAKNDYGSLENDPHDIVRFDVAVPSQLSADEIADYIDADLDVHMDAAIKTGGAMVISALRVADASAPR